MNNFWTNLFNRPKTYTKPAKTKKPASPVWNQQEAIRISKTITMLKRHKQKVIQNRKSQLYKRSHA
jgi:hypothetical protein